MYFGIVDYGAGNLSNVTKAVEFLGRSSVIVKDGPALAKVDAVILPGVGAFGQGMDNLARTGLVDAIQNHVELDKKPILGICLGMHLLGEMGYEGGKISGLGLLPMVVPRFETSNTKTRLPHIGWNSVEELKEGSVLFRSVPNGSDFYFVHSYHVVCKDKCFVAATCNYCYQFAAAIEHKHIFATQFHPEKSQRYGLMVLENYFCYCETRG